MSRTLIVGIDNGNKCTKSSSGLNFESGLAESLVEPLDKTNMLIYSGRYFTCGAKRMGVLVNKAQTEDTFTLSLPGIAEAAIAAGYTDGDPIDIKLGVGLPISSYSKLKADFRKYFLDERQGIRFKWKDTPFHINIVDCKVYPQGYAAFLSAYSDYKDEFSVNVIDIGGYTIEAFTVRFGRLVTESCISLNSGIIKMLNAIRDDLVKQDINISEQDLEAIISGKASNMSKVDMMSRAYSKKYIRSLLSEIKERGFELRNQTIFLGGGADLYEQDIRKMDDVIASQFMGPNANANAYKMLVEQEERKAHGRS